MRSLLISIIILTVFIGYGQSSKLDTLFQMKTSATMLRIDDVGNFFLVEKEQIAKYSKSGDTLFISSNKLFGDISHIDMTFALKPLVFNANQNLVFLLDNTLTIQGEPVDLFALDILQPMAVCNSYTGNVIWVFNQDNYELLRIDRSRGTNYKSGNLAQQLGFNMEIAEMVEYKNKLYMNDPEQGIHIFDIFGSYLRTLPIKGATGMHFRQDILGYRIGSSFNTYNLKSLEQKSWNVPPNAKVYFGSNRIYMLFGGKVMILGKS